MKRNGCYNRPPLGGGHTYSAQDGWLEQPLGVARDALGQITRIPIIVQVPHVMSVDCEYSQRTINDPGCDGCKWRFISPSKS